MEIDDTDSEDSHTNTEDRSETARRRIQDQSSSHSRFIRILDRQSSNSSHKSRQSTQRATSKVPEEEDYDNPRSDREINEVREEGVTQRTRVEQGTTEIVARRYQLNEDIDQEGAQDQTTFGNGYSDPDISGEESRNDGGINDWKSKYIELKTKFDTNRKLLPSCEIYSDGKNINKGTKLQLELLVKNVMFPKQKFIDHSELGDLSRKDTIGNKLMDKLNIPDSDRIETWKNYAYVVKKHLDKVRSSKTAGMKNEFFKRGNVIVSVIISFYGRM